MPAHVLVVDDDASVRRLLQLNLQRVGFRITLAENGVEALAIIAADRPDLVLSDVTMPQMDGIELVRRIRADPDTANIRIVMLTAKAQDQDFLEAERSGAQAYVNKPFHPLKLVEIIQQTLAAPA